MKAAIYTRKSTEQNGADDLASTERQKDACLEWAKDHGYTVEPEHIFNEGDGVSGTIAFEKRPAMARLLAAAKARAFQVLVVWRDDRLSREDDGGLVSLLRVLAQSKVRVFYAQSGKEALLKGINVVLASVEGYGSAAYAEKIKTDTASGRARRFATIDAWCSGHAPYGYVGKRVNQGDDPRSGHTILVPDAEQAAVVNRIFTMVAAGTAVRQIRSTLNAEGIAAPTRGKAKGTWAIWSITTICRNRTYIGETSLNVDPKVPGSGQTRQSESIRIIDAALWTKVQRVLDKNVVKYSAHRGAGGKLVGRPEGGRLTAYALSDLLVCGVCGSKLWIVPNKGVAYARCKRSVGHGTCENKWGAPYAMIESALVGSIARLDPKQLKARYLEAHKALVASTKSLDAEIAAQVRAIAKLEVIVARLVTAIEDGQPVGGALKTRQGELEEAQVRLATLQGSQAQSDLSSFDWDAWMTAGAKFPALVREAFQSNLAAARALLKLLLPEPVKVTPVFDPAGERFWSIRTNLNLDPIFDGQDLSHLLVGVGVAASAKPHAATAPQRAGSHRSPVLQGLGLLQEVAAEVR